MLFAINCPDVKVNDENRLPPQPIASGNRKDREFSAIPLSALAAEKCNCYFHAIRWLEQFGAQRREELKNGGGSRSTESVVVNVDDHPMDEVNSSGAEDQFYHQFFYYLEVVICICKLNCKIANAKKSKLRKYINFIPISILLNNIICKTTLRIVPSVSK